MNSTSPVEDEKEEEEKEECNFLLVGPPRDVFVEKVAQKVEALPPPEQKYIPSTEAIDELSENLAHGMYFSQSIARVIAAHVSKETVRDMLPAIEFSCRELIKEEMKKMFNPDNLPSVLHSLGFRTSNTDILTGLGFETVRRSDMYDEVNKEAELKFC